MIQRNSSSDSGGQLDLDRFITAQEGICDRHVLKALEQTGEHMKRSLLFCMIAFALLAPGGCTRPRPEVEQLSLPKIISGSDQVNHMEDKRNAVNSALIIALEGYF